MKRPAINCEECGKFAAWVDEEREDFPSSPEQVNIPQKYRVIGWECKCGCVTVRMPYFEPFLLSKVDEIFSIR